MAGKSKEEVEKLMIGLCSCFPPEDANPLAGPANTPITMIFTRPPSTQGKSGAQGEQVGRSSDFSRPHFSFLPADRRHPAQIQGTRAAQRSKPAPFCRAGQQPA
eukprot:608625-Hanusia_phi.AAC.5